jgi:hypothetical protein
VPYAIFRIPSRIVQLPPNSGSANSRVCRVHGTITAICCKGFKALVLHFAARCVMIYNIVPHTLSVRTIKAQSHNQGPSKIPHSPSVPCMHVYIARHQGPWAHRYKCVMQSTSVCDEPIRIGSSIVLLLTAVHLQPLYSTMCISSGPARSFEP